MAAQKSAVLVYHDQVEAHTNPTYGDPIDGLHRPGLRPFVAIEKIFVQSAQSRTLLSVPIRELLSL